MACYRRCSRVIEQGLLLLTITTILLINMATQVQMKSDSVFKNALQGEILINGTTQFAWDLFRQLGQKQPDDNIFFSPISISIALAMTYMGARGNTAAQMKEKLGFSQVDDDHLHTTFADLHRSLQAADKGFELHTANRLYGQKGYNFLKEFLDGTRVQYSAELESVDFSLEGEATRQKINTWVEDQTAKKIQNLLAAPLDASTRLILVNAIYFKGDWANKFYPKRTKLADFHLPSGEKTKVDMMFQKEKVPFGYNDELNSYALELPYVGSLSMVFILPDTKQSVEHSDGLTRLQRLEKVVTLEQLLSLNKIFRMNAGTDVNMWIPKFKLEQSFSLNDHLAEMGVQDLFDANNADLSGMDGSQSLFVSKVVHKAFIEVNEEGSEAVAASLLMSRTSYIGFRADHPFLFMIRDNRTQSILFLGRMANPSAGTSKDEL